MVADDEAVDGCDDDPALPSRLRRRRVTPPAAIRFRTKQESKSKLLNDPRNKSERPNPRVRMLLSKMLQADGLGNFVPPNYPRGCINVQSARPGIQVHVARDAFCANSQRSPNYPDGYDEILGRSSPCAPLYATQLVRLSERVAAAQVVSLREVPVQVLDLNFSASSLPFSGVVEFVHDKGYGFISQAAATDAADAADTASLPAPHSRVFVPPPKAQQFSSGERSPPATTLAGFTRKNTLKGCRRRACAYVHAVRFRPTCNQKTSLADEPRKASRRASVAGHRGLHLDSLLN